MFFVQTYIYSLSGIWLGTELMGHGVCSGLGDNTKSYSKGVIKTFYLKLIDHQQVSLNEMPPSLVKLPFGIKNKVTLRPAPPKSRSSCPFQKILTYHYGLSTYYRQNIMV